MEKKRPFGECYDCGRKYGGMGWVDVSVSDETWEKINPTDPKIAEAGLLCFCCMAKRCAQLGLTDVEIELKSGPFKLS